MKIDDIQKYMEHSVGEMMCWNCGHRWIAVYPSSTLLKELECPNCNKQGYAFATGQVIEDE